MSVIDGDNIAPTFYRDFATTQALNAGIGPAITFSRGSNALYTDINGNLQYASNNVLLNSEATSFTSWNIVPTGTLGLTRTLTTSAVNGYNLTTITWSGTANANGTLVMDPNTTTAIPAFVGQTWTFSTFASLSVGSGIAPTAQINVGERTSAGTLLAATPTYFTSNTLTRYSVTRTLNQPAVTRVTGEVRAAVSINNAYNFVIRISQPQLELGVTSPTEYKPTTGTAYYGPRFDFDPNSRQCKGLLIEETRTNVLSGSSDLTTPFWLNYNTPVRTVGTGIAGQNSLIVTDNDTVGYAGIYQTYAPLATGSDYTFSCLIKKNSNQGIPSVLRFNANAGGLTSLQGVFYTLSSNTFSGIFNLINGVVPSTTDAGIRSYGTIDYGSYYRLYFTAYNNLSAFNRFEILPAHGNPASGTYTGSLEIAAPQIETGSFVTSYIPTMSAQETRSRDVANLLTTSISAVANRNQGTLTCTFTPGVTSNNPVYASIGVDGQNYYALRQTTSTYTGLIRKTSITAGDMNATPNVLPLPFIKNKMALTYSLSGYSFAVNGGNFNSNTRNDLFLPAFPVYLGLGGIDSGNAVNGSGWISSVAYYPYAMTPFQLRALTR